MAAVVGSLLVQLQGDAGPLARALGVSGRDITSLERRSNRSFARIDRNMATTGQRARMLAVNFTAVGTAGTRAFSLLRTSALAGLAPILGLTGAIAGAQRALSDFDKTAKSIRFAGFADSDQFQGLQRMLDLGGVGRDQSAKALADFNRNMGQMASETGRAYSQLKILDSELLAMLQNASSQEERLRIFADRMSEIDDSGRRAAIGTALFGSEGAKMAEILAQGSAEIDKTTAAAKAMGLVIERDVLANAERMNDELSTSNEILRVQLGQALIAIIPLLIRTAQFAAGLAGAIRDTGDAIHYLTGSIGEISTTNLEGRIRAIGAERVALENEIHALRSQDVGHDPLGWASRDRENQIEHIRAKLAELADEERRFMQVLNDRPNFSNGLDLPGLNLPEIELDFDSQISGRNEAAQAAIRQAEAVKSLVEDLQHEEAQLGRTSEEQELYNHLKRIGVERESEYGRAIEGALVSLQEKRREIERNQDAMRQFGDVSKSVVNTFLSDIEAGKSAAESFGNLLRNLGSQIMNLGINAVFGAFGFSDGGPVELANGGHVIGRGGPRQDAIPAMLSNGEYVINARATAANRPLLDAINSGSVIRASTGGFVRPEGVVRPEPAAMANIGFDQGDSVNQDMAITYAPNIDARGADAGAVARLERALAKDRAEFPSRVAKIMHNAKVGRLKI